MEIVKLKIKDLQTNIGQIPDLPMNPREWTQADVDRLAASLRETPELFEARPVLVVPQGKKYVILGGNMRYEASKKNGESEIPAIIFPADTPTAKLKELVIKDNGNFGNWSFDALANEWDDLPLTDWGVPAWKTEVDEEEKDAAEDDGANGLPDVEMRSLEEYFIVPPFSVLDTRSARWQTRKAAWNEKIGDLGESRNDLIFSAPEMRYPGLYHDYLNATRKHTTKAKNFREYLESVPAERMEIENKKRSAAGVSILDPVLAEIACKWFGIDGGAAFDCFAGDTCFGFVSASCGMSFTGIELRKEQVEINADRTKDLPATYICDDGQNVAKHIAPKSQDLLFSCPPYFNLEVYSDDPKDASNQDTYEDFIAIIRNAFSSAASCLKENRFAVIVVGDIRDDDSGEYYDFPGDVVRIFRDAGMHLMNELILIEATPSAALRAGKFMEGRKVVKCHQNVLVFYKGNPLMIADNFFPLDMDEERKNEIRDLISSLETPEMAGMSEKEYCAAIAAAASEKCAKFVQDSGISEMKNAMSWAKGMMQSQMYKPLIDYFMKARQDSGVTMKEIREKLGNNMGGHYFSDKSQWLLPTEDNYRKLQEIMPQLSRTYEDLQREFKNLSRLQNLSRNI